MLTGGCNTAAAVVIYCSGHASEALCPTGRVSPQERLPAPSPSRRSRASVSHSCLRTGGDKQATGSRCCPSETESNNWAAKKNRALPLAAPPPSLSTTFSSLPHLKLVGIIFSRCCAMIQSNIKTPTAVTFKRFFFFFSRDSSQLLEQKVREREGEMTSSHFAQFRISLA